MWQVVKTKKHLRPSASKFTVLRQLCNLIPSHLVPKLARETGVDKVCRTFSAWSHVVTMLYAQLTHAIGLNDVCDALRLHSGPLSAVRGATPPSRNGLSHAGKERKAQLGSPAPRQAIVSKSSDAARSAIRKSSQTRRLCSRLQVPSRANTPSGCAGCALWSKSMASSARWSFSPIIWIGVPAAWPISIAPAGQSRSFSNKSSKTLKLADFLGHSANAVRWQGWSALLCYLLLRFQAWISGWAGSFTRIFTLIRSALWQHLDLASLLKVCGTAGGSFRALATPETAYFPAFLR